MEYQYKDTDKNPALFYEENGSNGEIENQLSAQVIVSEESGEQKKPGSETSFSFLNSLSFDAGSFSSGEFHKTHKRRNSLIETLTSGVHSHPGAKPNNEDVYSLISWRQSPDNRISTKANDNNDKQTEEEPAQKKQKLDDSAKNQELDISMQYAFFAVYDGHGGIQAADFVNIHLHKNIVLDEKFPQDVEQAIFSAFLKTDEQFASYAKEKHIDGSVGTTITFALIVGNNLYVANVGDTEAVMSSNGKPTVITVSHSLSNESERKRIEQLDGKIVSSSSSLRLGHPVWNSKLINIGVTRSIGDLYFKDPEFTQNKPSGLIAEPFITKRILTIQDDFLLIASDGFWDKVNMDEAVEYVVANGAKDSDLICKELVEMSRKRKSKDNITALLVKFKPLGAG